MSWSPSLESRDSRGKLTTRRKRPGFRCRPFLLILLCVLWIYYGIGQRTRNFEPGGGTPDLEEGAFTIPTRNEASTLNSHPMIFDDIFDSLPSRTIAAVLPVTSSSLPHLSGYLSGLSTIPHLSEIHLLCPENVTNAVRKYLRQTLSRAQAFGHTEFFVTLWRHEWSEAESTLRVASGILSNHILVLSQDALASVDSVSRNILLSGPPLLPVPLGLRGSEVSCDNKYQGFSDVHFVSPPLLLPSHLRTTNQSYFHLTSWQELAAHFTQVEGVGGVVPSETPENTSSCHHLNASEMVPLHLGHSHPPSDSSEPNDALVILAEERGDIPALSKLACEFKSRGKEVELIAYGAPSGPVEPPDPTSGGCDVAYTQVHDLQDSTLYQLLGRSPGVFLTLKEYHLPPESPLEANAGATVIRIPRRDLPHCDWIASLGIRELRSEHSLHFFLSFRNSPDGLRLARTYGRDIRHHKR